MHILKIKWVDTCSSLSFPFQHKRKTFFILENQSIKKTVALAISRYFGVRWHSARGKMITSENILINFILDTYATQV